MRKISGQPAERFDIKKRGYLRKGYAADVTIFDPAAVAAKSDPLQRPEGYAVCL